MALILDVANRLLANPKPVLLLNTCELLNFVQAFPENQIGRLETAEKILEALTVNPDLLQIVISDLVGTEWRQNIDNKRTEADRHLKSVDSEIESIHKTWRILKKPLVSTPPIYNDPTLATALQTFVERLMHKAEVLEFDDACVRRAIERVISKQRPSHKGHLKDSFILEHYLSLSNLLKANHFQFRRAFVSSNIADFSEGRNEKARDQLHPDLDAEFVASEMEYFINLNAAYEQLIQQPTRIGTP